MFFIWVGDLHGVLSVAAAYYRLFG